MLNKLPIILFYPVALIWSIFYGGLAGIFFKLLSVYENCIAINRLHLNLWKRYPQRSYRKYIESMWQQQIDGKPIELAEYSRLQLEKDHPAEPFPVLRILVNTVFMVLISPFMALSGLYYGPVYVYRTTLQQYQHAMTGAATE